MKLQDLPMASRFYWKGKKYKIFFRIKKPVRAYKITVCEWPNGPYVEMPSSRQVKEIIR